MFTIPNQSSIPKAYEMFTPDLDGGQDGNNESERCQAEIEKEGGSRLMQGSHRDRVVDCVEEFVKYTLIMREHFELFNDRYSERKVVSREAKPTVDTNGVSLKQI